MVARRVLITAMVAFLGVGVSAGWADEGPFPVRLNPRLALESVDAAAIDARLRGSLWPDIPDDEGLEIFKFRKDPWFEFDTPFEDLVIDRRFAANCVNLAALTNTGYLARYRNDRELQQGLLKECEAIEFLRKARPARISHVREFRMSSRALDWLPVMLDNGIPLNRLCDELAYNDQGVPWSAVDRIAEVQLRDQFTMRVWAEAVEANSDEEFPIALGADTWVEILAWADFNDDGVEDMLLLTSSVSMEWQGPDRRLFFARHGLDNFYVVTRDAPDAVLRVIDAEQYLTDEWLELRPCHRPTSTP